MQITHIVRDSPLRDLRVVLSQCVHVVVPDEEDSFKFNPEEELDIAGDDDGDSDETDDDYVAEGGSGNSGESDGKWGEIQEEGMGTIWRGAGKIHKKGVGKIQKDGAGEILKEGVGVTPKEGEGSEMGKGMWGSKRKCSATPPPPQITWCAHKSQDASPDHAPCRRHGTTGEQKE